jgi:PE-PPE domain/PE family
MTSVVAQPQFMAAAAQDIANIESLIGDAQKAAAGPTTGVVAAAQDEVSAVTTNLFNSFGKEYQALISQAGAFQAEFAQLLSGNGLAYSQAEAQAAAGLGSLFGPGATPTFGPGPIPPANPALVDAILIMTGSGTATPSVPYMNNVFSRFLQGFFAGPLQAVSTAEGLYPFTGVKDLTLDISLARGVTELDNAINSAITPILHGGTGTISVLGYSQSSIIASLEMPKLIAEGFTANQINFTLLGDPSAPNGGLFARFPGLSLPSLGVTFGTSTPSNLFPTSIYTLEYDGFADFPQYPINILSDLNALAGIVFVHGTYPTLTAAQLASAFSLPGSANLGTPGSMTNYYMIPTQNLPLLEPLRAIPVLGNPLADLIQPDLKYLVNWGYGDPNYGFSTGPANVQTPFGFLPPLSATTALGPLLISGAQQGVSAFASDLSHMTSSGFSLPGLGGGGTGGGFSLPALPTSVDGVISAIQSANSNIVNTLTTDVSTAYATLLPTADIATAALISLPSYDVNLFLNGIGQAFNGDPIGGLVNAIGQPIAADVGLVTLAGGFELINIENAFQTIVYGTPNPGPF